MIFFNKYSNTEAAVIKLLKYLNVQIGTELIVSELQKHPDYPSLLAVSDVLSALNVDNIAHVVSFDDLVRQPLPLIAFTYSRGGEFVVVSQIINDCFYISNEMWDNHKLSNSEFKKNYGGTILNAEPNENFQNSIKPRLANLSTNSLALFAGIALILGSAIYLSEYFTYFSWQLLMLTLITTAGLVTSILLLIQSIDSNNPLVQALCKGTGKSDCNAILSSSAAKVPIAIGINGLSWSEVGFFYYAGTWLLVLFGGNTSIILKTLLVLNAVSLPYTFYSIYYQARIAKQWCVLCCTVQALLWLEFVPLLATYFKPTQPGSLWGGISAVFICLISPTVLLALLKPLFLQLQQLKRLKDQLRKFKYNAELFNKILTAQPNYTQPDEEWCITLGNVEASNIITMVTNPYCPPCAKTHKVLDELLEQNSNVQARIVFTASNTDDDFKTPVSRHLMALNDLADKTIIKNALHDWYEQKQKNYEAWAKVYPVEIKEVGYSRLDKQQDWNKMAEVTATPTLLLNGYRLPDLYQLPDLTYMLE